MLYKSLYQVIFFGVCNLIIFSCVKPDSVDLIVEKPEMLKKDRIASFYGPEAMKECQVYRKVYAGFCDTTNQPFVKCFDINDKKYKLTSCE